MTLSTPSGNSKHSYRVTRPRKSQDAIESETIGRHHGSLCSCDHGQFLRSRCDNHGFVVPQLTAYCARRLSTWKTCRRIRGQQTRAWQRSEIHPRWRGNVIDRDRLETLGLVAVTGPVVSVLQTSSRKLDSHP